MLTEEENQLIIDALFRPTVFEQAIAMQNLVTTREYAHLRFALAVGTWMKDNAKDIIKCLVVGHSSATYYKYHNWEQVRTKHFNLIPLPQQQGRWTMQRGALIFHGVPT